MTDTTHTTPTPETTPLPGGGSWRWDDVLPGWVPNDPPPAAATEPDPTPRPVRAVPMQTEA